MSNNSLTVCNTSIRQDADGRYFLNDLHKASGNNPKDKPFEWLRNKGTQDLIAEIIKQEIPASEKINDLEPVKTVNSFTEEQGTYVIKELVYYYAMWISPAFTLQVIRSYDALVTSKTPDYSQPITTPITIEEFEVRHAFYTQALEQLKTATVTMTVSGADCMRMTKNSNNAINNRISTTRRKLRKNTLWTPDDIAQLHDFYYQDLNQKDIAEKMNRTCSGIRGAVSRFIKAGM